MSLNSITKLQNIDLYTYLKRGGHEKDLSNFDGNRTTPTNLLSTTSSTDLYVEEFFTT